MGLKNKYLKELSRYLKINRKLKKKVLEELSDEIELRKEKGESISDILDSLGPSSEVADEFNTNFANDNRDISLKDKISIVLLSMIVITFFILAMHNFISIIAPSLSVPYILSSVSEEGNSASFMAFKLSYKGVILKAVIELSISTISLIGIIKLKKHIQKKW